jgi:hypothetical protein
VAYAPEPAPFEGPIFGAIKYYLNFAFYEKTRYVGVQLPLKAVTHIKMKAFLDGRRPCSMKFP